MSITELLASAAFSDPDEAPAETEAAVPVRLFGVRHHGPGSARSLVAALDSYRPDVVLIEGPPEAEELLSWVGNPGLQPPVALFAYQSDHPENSAFWPLAVFSPEWQAMTWAVTQGKPVRFIDLPAATVLAENDTQKEQNSPESDTQSTFDKQDQSANLSDSDPEQSDNQSSPAEGTSVKGTPAEGAPAEAETAEEESVSDDPFSLLASMAGIEDPERWWDEMVESVPDQDRFAAVASMMIQLREARESARTDSEPESAPTAEQLNEDRREAMMRTQLRKATKEFAKVAVVVGAWHVPALTEPLPPAKQDNALLKGLPKTRCSLAWVPWTHSRLSFRSGYGAGVLSPGWYHHLFTVTEQPTITWLARVAEMLRTRDLPVSSAHIIEATRLCETLAALRGRMLPGLGEVTEAVRAVLCEGDDLLVDFIQTELVVGEELGTVPEGAPLVPLDADLRKSAKTLRLPFSAAEKEITLDLRKDFDLQRSALLHRLEILGIPWGVPRAESGTGTFKEAWTLCWKPDFAVQLVEASGYGTTLATAAASRLTGDVESLEQISHAIEMALLADLPETLDSLLTSLDAQAAAEGDVQRLLGSVPPLARSARYGNVRESGDSRERLAGLAHSVLVRGCAGFGPQAASLGDDAIDGFVILIDEVQRAVGLLGEESTALWQATLRDIADRRDVASLLLGRVTRLLFDAQIFDSEEVASRLSLALTSGHTPAEQARWAEGLLRGDALLLIHDQSLLRILDSWVAGLSAEDFIDIPPLIRRSFGSFRLPERRQIEQRITHLDGDAATTAASIDLSLSMGILSTIRQLLGARNNVTVIPESLLGHQRDSRAENDEGAK